MKILIALDESENALRAGEFIADHFTSEHQVTVSSVIPEVSVVCEYVSPGYFLSEQKSFCEMEENKTPPQGGTMVRYKGRSPRHMGTDLFFFLLEAS